MGGDHDVASMLSDICPVGLIACRRLASSSSRNEDERLVGSLPMGEHWPD